MPVYQTSLFIFRRDLRLEDNTALIAALRDSTQVIAAFIFDPRQIEQHAYQSKPALQFMRESLIDLENQLKKAGGHLYFFQGLPDAIINTLIPLIKVEAVYLNKDYTPFSIKRDKAIADVCLKAGVSFYAKEDLLLHPPAKIRTNDGGIYTVFTPFCRKAKTLPVALPFKNQYQHYYQKPIAIENRDIIEDWKKSALVSSLYPGGRMEALNILGTIAQFKSYDTERNFPFLNRTSKLSMHHKFGTCSIREAYQAIKDTLGVEHTLITELYWRDFFTHIGYHFPQVLGSAFHQQYNGIAWANDPALFKAWCEGQTGFPIVDAGMRELNETGFMHNRLRMIAASFLVKDLMIDWRWGEKYFATRLVDYDPLVNNGNWQWAASTGCDAQPYFRIFNPWLQQVKFDPDAGYIKKWVAQLRPINAKDLHELHQNNLSIPHYPRPIVDHQIQKEKTLKAFRQIRG